jgi:hypothetical protein
MQNNYMVHFGGPEKSLPWETGGDFWLKLSRPPLIDETMADIFRCPARRPESPRGACDYRGPNGNANACADGAAIGADLRGSHRRKLGHCVLRKSGDVQLVNDTDPLWPEAARTPRP